MRGSLGRFERPPGERHLRLGLAIPRLDSSHALGAVPGKWYLGRVIAYIVVFTQVALGAAMASLEARLPRQRARLVPACTLGVLLGLFAYDRPPFPQIIKYDRPRRQDVRKILAPVRLVSDLRP